VNAANPPVPMVGIGASAGGIEAFKGFFENMPPDSGLAFIVVLHLPHNRKSVLPEILARWTGMPVVEVTEGVNVAANHVYVPPPGVVVTLKDGHLHLLEVVEPRESNPISVLFDSLATELGEDAIGVVLSGTGHDGSLGLKAIKENGGLTLAQGTDGTRPMHEGMPSSAIATGAVDVVASVEAMPGHIIAIQRARSGSDPETEVFGVQLEAARQAICAILLQQLDHDFSGYKEKTFVRRVQRRMQVTRVRNIQAYVARLENDREEVMMLFRDLLIGVTSFFRDAEIFDALERQVIPRLFENTANDGAVRVWIPGCSTGEEAYSIAILLREYSERLNNPPPVQVFATDIDDAAISTARAGRYPSTLLRGLAAERLTRFFVEGHDGGFTVAKDLREICTFSTHSLVRDPPFSRMSLVSCRNLLIYLDADAQSIIIPAFHYSLVRDGILLLGSSENVSRHENLFSMMDRGHRIFVKRDVPSPPLVLAGKARAGTNPLQRTAPSSKFHTLRTDAKMNNWANARVLEQFAPAFVVVTGEGNSLQYSSRIHRFLELAAGMPSQNVLTMARGGLRASLRAALREAVETGNTVVKPPVAITIPGEGQRHIIITVEPRREKNADTLYLIVFSEIGPATGRSTALDVEDNFDPHTEAELRDTREQLQSITEEHETALEELRSANEELHSINEELQSTNEELETSKEEIQSMNEELQTVNAQLASKVEELDNNNSDLRNLFESTQVATLFLDAYLIVRSFTPAVANIYNLIPSDQGRSITDIVSKLRYSGLREDVSRVLSTLEPLERRVVKDDDQTHYLMRILPYRTPDSSVDGTIITFIEVTSIVQAEQHQRLLVDELNHRVKNMLTVVISLASQTLRRSDSLEQFSMIFMGRIHALTSAYSLLSDEGWQTVSLRDLLNEELKPFVASDRRNITLEGPRVLIEPRAALALGMAVHELTTNAVKYGALSVEEGNVKVSWQVASGPDGDQLLLEWSEKDGPEVSKPTHRGFGTTLIERGLRQDMAATVDIDFATSGITASLRAPLRSNLPEPIDIAMNEPAGYTRP
jgi:two-component system CheB/CheR fusion protein